MPAEENTVARNSQALQSDNLVLPIAKTAYKPEKQFSALDRSIVVDDCSALPRWNAVNVIAQKNTVTPKTVRKWMKEAGRDIPADEIRQEIVKKCANGEVSPEKVADTIDCHKTTIIKWAKKSGEVLPGRYAEQYSKSESTPVLALIKCPKEKCSYETKHKGIMEKHVKSRS